MKKGIRRLLAALALAAAAAWAPAAARAETTLQFYFPVAVGGPITKIIDGMVADFERANPAIKVKPIYAGSYQDTVAKVLTAIKGGDVPQLSVILSTDMFTLIDEDAILPFEELRQDGRGQELDGRLLSRLHGEQPHRREDLGHSLPALDHRDVLEQGGLQGGRT